MQLCRTKKYWEVVCGLGWHTAHASSIDEKGLIYIYISLRQLPPRLVRVLLVTIDMKLPVNEHSQIRLEIHFMSTLLSGDGIYGCELSRG